MDYVDAQKALKTEVTGATGAAAPSFIATTQLSEVYFPLVRGSGKLDVYPPDSVARATVERFQASLRASLPPDSDIDVSEQYPDISIVPSSVAVAAALKLQDDRGAESDSPLGQGDVPLFFNNRIAFQSALGKDYGEKPLFFSLDDAQDTYKRLRERTTRKTGEELPIEAAIQVQSLREVVAKMLRGTMELDVRVLEFSPASEAVDAAKSILAERELGGSPWASAM